MRRFPHRAVALACAVLAALCTAAGAPAQPSGPMSGDIVAAAAAGGVRLNGPATRVSLAPVDGTENLARRLTALGRERRFILVLGDLRAEVQPGIVYDIYLGLPPGTVGDDAYLVGTLNFFAVALPNKAPKSRSYDVTRTVGMLLSRGLPADGLAVTIIPAAGAPTPNATPPAIGRLALIAQ